MNCCSTNLISLRSLVMGPFPDLCKSIEPTISNLPLTSQLALLYASWDETNLFSQITFILLVYFCSYNFKLIYALHLNHLYFAFMLLLCMISSHLTIIAIIPFSHISYSLLSSQSTRVTSHDLFQQSNIIRIFDTYFCPKGSCKYIVLD